MSATCFDPGFKLGILGGGQLGKMLLAPAYEWNLATQVLDPDPHAPAARLCPDFRIGALTDRDTVLHFGASASVLTIEIEHVDAGALQELTRRGVEVHPDPQRLEVIQDKGRQKEFLAAHGIPSAPHELFADADRLRQAVRSGRWSPPFVQKSRLAGYDGRGVRVVRGDAELQDVLDVPCLVESQVAIAKELSVIACRSTTGETACFPTVEMEFHPDGNLVERLLCPADVSDEIEAAAEALAIRTIESFALCGLLAVEMFLTEAGELLVNEVAPRPHNSGHHTIETSIVSQYEQHLRGILGLPLGSTRLKGHAAMVNLLGPPYRYGPPRYRGLEQCLALEGCYVHIYGKQESRPFRKMGHVTILGRDREDTMEKARIVQQQLRVIA